MIKRYSSGGESSSAARKRQATSAPDDEDPLVPSSTPEHDASSVPSMLPINLIAALVLSCVQDRSTWNSVCLSNKELSEAGKRMRPPWPNATLNVGGGHVLDVSAVTFSPCKSFLACSMELHAVIRVWDRYGEQTRLEGHTGGLTCLQYSLDGKYLASGSCDTTIRLWHVASESKAAHSSSSDESRRRGTSRGTPQAQSDIILRGHRSDITALAFSPTDSNLLASGCRRGEIKLWDVINQVCVHAFPHRWGIETIFFSAGDNIQCYVVTRRGRMIRIVRNESMEFAATIIEELSLGEYPLTAFSPCGTCLAACSYMGSGSKWELALFDLRTMAKTQSVVISDHRHISDIAMSPDGKKLAITNNSGGTRLIECHDLTIQKYVDTIHEPRADEATVLWHWPVAFDPTSRLYAVGRLGGRVELRTL
jgi:WD40 repeat protein